jgi:adenylate cyclase
VCRAHDRLGAGELGYPGLVVRDAGSGTLLGWSGHDVGMAKSLDWQALLVEGYEPLKKAQRVFRLLPHDPRCKLCQNPFGGVGGKLVVDCSPIVVEPRTSANTTPMSISIPPLAATEFAERLNQFYATATNVLIHHDGLVDKLIGDQVMALFIPGLAGPDYRRVAALAAVDLAGAVGDLPVGVAANAGIAFVGNVGSGTVMDFTALGDAVNVGVRLQAHAAPGEVVLCLGAI